MKKFIIGASLLALIGTGALAQAPEKELQFAVLHNTQTKEKVAEVTVSTSGLHLKVVGYPQLDLSFQDIELLKRSVEVMDK